MNFGHYGTVALRKLGRTDDPKFVLYAFESLPPDITKISGCVSSGLVTKGKRKGRPRYDGKREDAYVTDAEYIAERDSYETRTGLCAECMGEAKVFASWDHIEGTKYRPCAKCDATGKAKVAA